MTADLRAARAVTLRVPSPLVELVDDRLAAGGVRMWLKRDDLIHPEIPGNKWRKLKYNLLTAQEQGAKTLLTFGGAYSNHLQAVAAAGYYFGFDTIGIVRGEEHLPLNPSLAFAVSRGMRLGYLDRTTYRSKHTADLCGHSGTTVTESVYRHQLRPVLLHGTVAMDQIFEAEPSKSEA